MSKKKGKNGPKIKEGSIEAVILRFLNILPDTFAWKNDSVGIYDSKRGVYRKKKKEHHINGVSDIIGIHRGRFMAIEVKTKTGTASDDQKLFIARILKEGGIAGIARSVADARKILNEADTHGGI
jgi:hypothetical protein